MLRFTDWRAHQAEIVELLDRGGVLAVPTESSYGLACDPQSELGVAAVFDLKRRAPDIALPVVFSEIAQLEALGVPVDSYDLALFDRVWPAPLTVVVPLDEPIPASGGRSSLAVRKPAHPALMELLSATGKALTATSANRSGEDPLCDPELVVELLEGCDAGVFDGGLLSGGQPSTVVVWNGCSVQVLRWGRFDPAQLELPIQATPNPRPIE